MDQLYQRIISKKVSTKRALLDRLLLAKSLLDNAKDRTWTVGQLARESAISEYHFIRKFREAFGTSPYQYQLNKRLEWSIDLMMNDDITLNCIALTTGFSHLYAYSKCFKNKYGLPPRTFKLNLLADSLKPFHTTEYLD